MTVHDEPPAPSRPHAPLDPAVSDALTGVYNRSGLIATAKTVIALAARERQHVALLAVKLQGLEALNARLGRALGDRALTETAALLSRLFRAADAVARVGGDRFAVLMIVHPRVDMDRLVRRRLGRLLGEQNERPGRDYPLSLSLGVSARPGAGADIHALLASAATEMSDVQQART